MSTGRGVKENLSADFAERQFHNRGSAETKVGPTTRIACYKFHKNYSVNLLYTRVAFQSFSTQQCFWGICPQIGYSEVTVS